MQLPEKLFGLDMISDPYPIYNELRSSSPVHWDSGLNAWVVTRYHDVAMILTDRRFSARRVEKGRKRFPQPEFEPLFDTLAGRMTEQDEPGHKRLRALVQNAFVRSAVSEWRPRIESKVEELLDKAESAVSFDFVEAFAIPLPLEIILAIVAIPEPDRRQVKAWSDDFAYAALNFYGNITEPDLHRAMTGVLAFKEFLRGQVEKLRESPGDDLLSSLIHAEEGGSRLTLEELLANTLLLLSAGNETVTCVLANGMDALLRQPEQLERLRSDPSAIPNAVEEILRLEGPVQFLGRIATEELTIHDTSIAEGDLVLAVIGSANRDPEQFKNPDRLDVDRSPIPHLAFGMGHHFCAGAQLARLEITTALEKILDRFSSIERDSLEPVSYRANANVRCVESLLLRVKG